jgi:serine/threonine-protein phosphatase 2A regulatory subunit B'
MVYNALKLFMEINPDLFDESMQQYKQHKIEYVSSFHKTIS